MTTGTGGTNANSSLTSLQFAGALAPADIATIQQLIWSDAQNIYPNNPTATLNTITDGNKIVNAFAQTGLLYIPNRGVLRCQPGDRVMVDTVSGWPILVSRTAIGVGGSVWTSTS
jgi:hypothetical protein